MAVTYGTCGHCGEPIVRLNNGRWRHCANTSRWCGVLPQGPVAEPTTTEVEI